MKIGILGGRELLTASAGPICRALGRRIVLRGHTLVTGGAKGAGAETSRAAHEALSKQGCDPRDQILSFVPEGETPEHAYGRYEHRGFTWKERRGLLVLEADFFVVVGGADGTLDEVCAAHRERVALLPLPDSGGVAAHLYRHLAASAAPEEKTLLSRCELADSSRDALAKRVIALAEEYLRKEGGDALLRSLMLHFWEGTEPSWVLR